MDRLKSPEAIANHQARQKRNREACNKTDKRKVKKSKNKAARLGTEQEVLTPEEFEAHVAGHRLRSTGHRLRSTGLPGRTRCWTSRYFLRVGAFVCDQDPAPGHCWFSIAVAVQTTREFMGSPSALAEWRFSRVQNLLVIYELVQVS
jgi:hypothetical protein